MSCDVVEVTERLENEHSFRHFTYVTGHSITLPSLYLRHSSFYSPSVASPTSQALHLRHRHSIYVMGTSPTSQLILQPFLRFTYVTGHSIGLTLPFLHLSHRHFTYFTWRAAHAQTDEKTFCGGLACYSKLLSFEVGPSYSFGQLLRNLLRAVNLFSFSHKVSSGFNIHNAFYFVKYPSRATQNSPKGRRRPAGRGLKTPALYKLVEREKALRNDEKMSLKSIYQITNHTVGRSI